MSTLLFMYLDIVQFGRTLDLGSRGHMFESCYPDLWQSFLWLSF